MKLKVYVVESGNTLNSKEQFLKRLPHKLKLVGRTDCHGILIFCPVISRVGTDIEAAVKDFLEDESEKYIILVVLHHTYDKDHVVPDSNKYRNKRRYIVNCLFHEDGGLLKDCNLNTEAIKQTSKYIKEIKAKIKQDEKEKKKRKKTEKKLKKKTKRNQITGNPIP